jgi:hypothetical protein
MISIVYGSPVAGSPNNWAAIVASADLADDAPNICKLALPTSHPGHPLFTLNGLARLNLNGVYLNGSKSAHPLNVNDYSKVVVNV